MEQPIERSANTEWAGDLAAGSGTVSFGSGAIGDSPVTWASRTETSDGKTSPEELIAAAHSSCYAMAFSHTLTQAGHKPNNLHVTAKVGLEPKAGGGVEVTSSALTVRGHVPSLTQDAFEDLANQAEQACPVSNALRNNLKITVDARLES
ncbi:MAG TPA: OsmC family peroxiredoxin [Thermomicrobiales bacterium]|nr:OsmC family peroxiredoxin [Thermomicrobiales bacterium]